MAKPVATQAKLTAYIAEVKKSLPAKATSVLPKITDSHRNLLSVRGYVRFANRMHRWPMNDTEEADFKETAEFQKLEKEKNKIIKKFADQNKGHTLKGQAKARSLETQINYWNGNATVLGLGKNLESKALIELGKTTYPESPTSTAVTTFTAWIKDVDLSAKVDKKLYNSPTHATPGLSSHGKIKAIDFVVSKGGKVIAGTKTSTAESVWDTPGWTKKLKTAVTDVSSNWDGPLKSPYEPWHYTYTGG